MPAMAMAPAAMTMMTCRPRIPRKPNSNGAGPGSVTGVAAIISVLQGRRRAVRWPSSISSEARRAVETCVSAFASGLATTAAVSPPPTTVVASSVAMARASATSRSRTSSFRRHPWGRSRRPLSPSSLLRCRPLRSRADIEQCSRADFRTLRVSALGVLGELAGGDDIDGRWHGDSGGFARSRMASPLRRDRSSTRDIWTSTPVAFRKVLAIPPPTRSLSIFGRRCSMRGF